MDIIDLKNTLKIDEQEYNINAVTADKVKAPFTVNISGQDSVEFDGSEAKNISVVSSETGGDFCGPITVPSFKKQGEELISTADIPGDNVVNFGDLSELITNITGAGWYSWDGNTFTQTKENDVAQHIGIVTGTDADVTAFAEKNTDEKYLPMYLYVSKIDNTIGDLYLGTSDEGTVTKLSVAQKLYNEDKTEAYDYGTIADLLTALGVLQTTSDEHNLSIIDLKTAVRNFISGPADDNETQLVIQRAAADASGNVINSYYQKKITIAKSDDYPNGPQGGDDGDIWILY